MGGSDYDRALSIAIDTGGNVYVGGSTISSNFPTTTGVYDTSFNGGASDAFLLKFDSDLNNLLASTYLGGTKDDYIYSIVIDTGGNIYMCGDTGSSDFPTTTGAYDTSINNGSNYYDGFVSKLDSGLTSLLASTYLGGSNSDHPRSVTKDSGGNIYVSGTTYSSDFPVTTGVYDTSFNGGVFDSFISKFNGTLASLLASTYLGGSGKESSQSHAPSLAIDTSGNILVTGTTYSSDFPTTTGVYDTSLGGDRDAYVSKISGDLTNLLASTYLGGSIYDEGYSIAGDSSGNIYVVGYTYSSDFSTTTGAYDTSYNSGNDAFVSKFNGSLTGLLASTYLGGSNGDEANALVIDSSGNIYIAGFTDSSEFPTTASAYDTSRGGATDAFISEFNGALTSLLASTYLGGSGIGDVCYSLAIDSGGNIYATGYTKSSDFPTTTGAYDTSYNDSSGSYDTFIAKLDSSLSATPSDTTAPTGSLNINSGASYTNSSTVTLTLSATDSTGVTGYYLSDSSTTPSASASGWTSVTSTTGYSASVSYSLSGGEGSKTIYAWYKDAAGNVSSTASATITLDTTVPTVTISSPTSNSTYTSTSSTISLGGSASDSSSGISSVAWSNNRGGNGTATGTASWTVSSISLSSGDNVITVTAKDGAGNSGTDTITVTYSTGTTVSVPTVSTGSVSSVTTSSATLSGTVNANGASTTAWFNYGTTSGSYSGTSTTQSVTGSSNTTVSIGISGLSSNTTYYYRIAASNSGGTSYGSELSFTTSTVTATPTPTPSTGDSSAPTDGSITINSGASYTNSTGVTLTLSAKDNTGVTGYYLSPNSSTPSSSASGWTSVSSSTSYSGSVSYTLSGSDGSKTVYVWFKDSSGNVSNAASDDITLDTTSPTINITSPTSDATYTATSSTISLGGSASDSTSGIKEVTWTNSSGGSGTASGTTSWTISSISLSNGDNTITVTAKDNAGNTATDIITVTYKSSSTNVPKVSTGSATNVTESSVTLSGTVNANGLTTTAWFNYGTNSGSYTNTTSTQTISGSSDTAISININGLSAGTKYYYKLSAQNSAGTSTGSESSFTTKSLTTTPTPGVTPLPTLPPLPTPQVSPSPINEGIVFGFVNDQDEQPLKGVTITITGKNFSDSSETDENGYYEFSGLSKGNYTLTYEKEGFLAQTQDVSLNEGEVKDLGTVTMEQVVSGKIYGNVVDIKGNPLEFVRLRLKGVKTKVIKTASSDADGFFEFTDLEADTYVIIAKKKKYRNTQQKVKLEEGASEEIEIVMKKTSKRIKGLLLEEDVQ